jgi:hypothetical protein
VLILFEGAGSNGLAMALPEERRRLLVAAFTNPAQPL